MNYRALAAPSIPDGYQVVRYLYKGRTFLGWVNPQRYPLSVYWCPEWLEPFDVVRHTHRWEAVLQRGREPDHWRTRDPDSVPCCLRDFADEKERDAALTFMTGVS